MHCVLAFIIEVERTRQLLEAIFQKGTRNSRLKKCIEKLEAAVLQSAIIDGKCVAVLIAAVVAAIFCKEKLDAEIAAVHRNALLLQNAGSLFVLGTEGFGLEEKDVFVFNPGIRRNADLCTDACCQSSC
jgi:hypothetical protein